MPLRRQEVTVASRIMLPAYIIHALFFAFVYIVDPLDNSDDIHALDFARLLMPMPAWGALLACIAAVMAAALITQRRTLMAFALYFYAVVNFIWAGIYFGAIFVSSVASLGALAWPLLGVAACVASARSLQAREV